MDLTPIKETFDELFSHLEAMETQSSALLQFLKDKEHVTDKDLAPYLEQAGNTSNVKWLATRLRMERLFESAEQTEENAAQEKKAEKEANANRNLVSFLEKSGKKESDEKPDRDLQTPEVDSGDKAGQPQETSERKSRVG